MATILENQFKFYLDHQKEFVEKFNHKHLVIAENKVFGAYDTQAEAYREAMKTLKPGTFLIQLVTPGSEAYSKSYHSRVAF